LTGGKQSHEVATDGLLASTGFSFHNCTTKHHHVSISGIFQLFRLGAIRAEKVEVFFRPANGLV
jgi:hypothetical protein